MSVAEECLRHAEKCEEEASVCSLPSNRDILLATAAQWRRLAELAAQEVTVHRLVAGRSMIQDQQPQQQQTKAPDQARPKN
jgi:hypothetical protein